MNGESLLARAAALMHETDISPYRACAVSWINTLLAENFALINRRREYAGLEPYRQLPAIASLAQELPCDEEFAAACLLYGLAALIFAEEANPPMLSMYKQECPHKAPPRGWPPSSRGRAK